MKSIIIPEKKSIIIPAKHNFIREHIADVKSFEFGGKSLLQVKDTLENVLILNGLGWDIESPILRYYDFPKVSGKYPPMPHQLQASAFHTLNRKSFNLSEPRTGKTYTLLWYFDYLRQEGLVKKCLIFSTLSTLNSVWLQSLFETFHHLNAVVVTGTAKEKVKLLKEQHDIYIINHDAAKNLEKELLELNADVILYDEADNLTNGQTALWKSINKINKPHTRLILASGTPTGENRPTDAFSLAKLVDSTKVPKYFGAFQRSTMIQISPFKWIPMKGSHETVHNVLQPAICFRKADVLKDLPEVTYERRECQLTEEQQKMYKDMKQDMEATSNAGEVISSVNAADRLTKLLQLLLGAYKTPEGEYISIDCHKRINTILECIGSTKEKAIIFIPFTGALQHYYKEIKKHYSCEYVDGSVSKSKRDEIFYNFQNAKSPHVLVCHPRVTAHGLELAIADKIIWAGPVHSGRTFMQACERNNSSKQKNPMTVYMIGANKLEWAIYDKLLSKKDMQNDVLNLYKAALTEK